jgi:hypothetical protein
MKLSGKTVTDFRTLENFSKISVFDKIDVELIQSDEYAVQITCGKNILPGIEYMINDDRLTIRNINTCELLRNSDNIPKVTIYFDSIQNIQIYNSGSVSTIDTLRLSKLNISKQSNGDLSLSIVSQNLFIYSNEYGDAYINGKVTNISTRQEGVGLLDLSNCSAKNVNIFTQGPGSTKIKCKEELKAQVIRTGRLFVYGDPKIRDVLIEDTGIIEFFP